eukprot:g1181.t1
MASSWKCVARTPHAHDDVIRTICCIPRSSKNVPDSSSSNSTSSSVTSSSTSPLDSLSKWSIVTGSRDRMIHCRSFNSSTGNLDLQWSIADHPHWVNTMISVNQGGRKRLITGCHDGKIRVYGLESDEKDPSLGSPRQLQLLSGHVKAVTSLASLPLCLPGGQSCTAFVTGSWDGSARVWADYQDDESKKSDDNYQRFTSVCELPGHETSCCVAGLPPLSKHYIGTVVTGSTGVKSGDSHIGFYIRVWTLEMKIDSMSQAGSIGVVKSNIVHQLDSHKQAIRDICALPHPHGLLASSCHPMFASIANDGCLNVYDATTGNCLQSKQLTRGFLHTLSCVGNGKGLAVGSDEQTVHLVGYNDISDLKGKSTKFGSPLTDNVSLIFDYRDTRAIASLGEMQEALVTGGHSRALEIFLPDGHPYCETEAARTAEANRSKAVATKGESEAVKVGKTSSNDGAAGNGFGQKIDPSTLPDVKDANTLHRGQKEGQIGFFRHQDGNAWIYSWDAANEAWKAIGEVIDKPKKDSVGSGGEDISMTSSVSQMSSSSVSSLTNPGSGNQARDLVQRVKGSTLQVTLKTLHVFTKNLLLKPMEPKYRKINLANAKVRERIVDAPGALDVLLYVGFSRDNESLMIEDGIKPEFAKLDAVNHEQKTRMSTL